MIEWDGTGNHPARFEAPFAGGVRVADGQMAVLVGGNAIRGSLPPGTHDAGALSGATQILILSTQPMSARFGSATPVRIDAPPAPGKLRHFGQWRYRVVSPKHFASAAIAGDPVRDAGQQIAVLLDACALEWIASGAMSVLDLAARGDDFRQVLPAHVAPAIAPLGLELIELGEIVPNFDMDM